MGSVFPCAGQRLNRRLSKRFHIPPLNDVIREIQQAAKPHLSSAWQKAIVWNVEKGKNRGWWSDFETFFKRTDLILIQEGILSCGMPEELKKQHLGWIMGVNFAYNQINSKPRIPAGVITGSRAHWLEPPIPLRSPHREKRINTPKMSLITKYQIEPGDKELLVINIHGLNLRPFPGGRDFRKWRDQIEAIEPFIQNHPGPVIFAGDFNTFKRQKKRLQSLTEITERNGLEEILFSDRGARGHKFPTLDRAFQRGLQIRHAAVRTDIKTSDHTPLYFEFKIQS